MKPLPLAALTCGLIVAGASAVAETTRFDGNLDGSQTWQRSASNADISHPLRDGDGRDQPYEIFLFTFDVDDPDVNIFTDFADPATSGPATTLPIDMELRGQVLRPLLGDGCGGWGQRYCAFRPPTE